MGEAKTTYCSIGDEELKKITYKELENNYKECTNAYCYDCKGDVSY